MKSLFYTVFDTAAGWIALMGSPVGLRCVTLPAKSIQEALNQLDFDISQAQESHYRFQDTIKQLNAYFDGNEVCFTDSLDFSEATGFQQEVWQATRLIPYRETRGYAWVAAQISRPKAARAVGNALGRNPMPVIIPCHRVIAGDGGLGGFTGGLEMKRFLLGIESKNRTD